MKIVHTALELGSPHRPAHAAIGVFDGLHLGHQAIIRRTLDDARATGGSSIVITFDRHPNAVVAPRHAPPLIYSPNQKAEAIASLGVEALLEWRFDTAFSQQPAADFIRGLARDLGQLKSLSVGANFTFGHRRGGNLELLRELGRELGFTAHGLPAVELDGVTISSTRIRDAIRAGNLESASRLLGRPYSLEGAVVAGDQIGRQMGFPTANLDVPGLLLPPNGVYAVQARTGGRAYPAVLNIGLRPTLKSPTPQLRVEAHLIHTQLDLYGARLELVFKARLRSEMPFHSLAELQAQIARDIASAQAIL